MNFICYCGMTLADYFLFLCTGGLLYYNGVSDDSSLDAALNVAMIMAIYGPIASGSSKNDSYIVSNSFIHSIHDLE